VAKRIGKVKFDSARAMGSFASRVGNRIVVTALAASLLGVAVGYVVWGWPKDWFRQHNVWSLPPGAQTDLVQYGWKLVVETPRHIGKSAADPAKRYAGNDLACVHCHINAGLKPFAAPFVSTFASFPMMVNDQVITLAERINGCMTRSMNGSHMPEDGREMEAIIAYLQFIGRDTPIGVRLAGMGLRSIPRAGHPPDSTRGQVVYREHCAACHGAEGQGELLKSAAGYAIPPVWGPDSFNTAAGMSDVTVAAAFIHANMPPGADYRSPILTEQQAWDVAIFMTSQSRPAPRLQNVARN
jgi:thiosulfate dehydrogenase